MFVVLISSSDWESAFLSSAGQSGLKLYTRSTCFLPAGCCVGLPCWTCLWMLDGIVLIAFIIYRYDESYCYADVLTYFASQLCFHRDILTSFPIVRTATIALIPNTYYRICSPHLNFFDEPNKPKLHKPVIHTRSDSLPNRDSPSPASTRSETRRDASPPIPLSRQATGHHPIPDVKPSIHTDQG
jgi:hypothetical protein